MHSFVVSSLNIMFVRFIQIVWVWKIFSLLYSTPYLEYTSVCSTVNEHVYSLHFGVLKNSAAKKFLWMSFVEHMYAFLLGIHTHGITLDREL